MRVILFLAVLAMFVFLVGCSSNQNDAGPTHVFAAIYDKGYGLNGTELQPDAQGNFTCPKGRVALYVMNVKTEVSEQDDTMQWIVIQPDGKNLPIEPAHYLSLIVDQFGQYQVQARLKTPDGTKTISTVITVTE